MSAKPLLRAGSSICIVGEAPGKTEEQLGIPFVGASGQELRSMLADAGIEMDSCSLTNVFHTRPPHNDITQWYTSKRDGGTGCPTAKGKYFNAQRYAERERLYGEIKSIAPTLCIALGNTATWALFDKVGIGYLRGVVTYSPYVDCKVLPTYHPAAVLRNFDLRSTTVVDLQKARRESLSREIAFPALRCQISPSLNDLDAAWEILRRADLMSYDIETAAEQITCIGFAVKGFAITVPFTDMTKPERSYWSLADEVTAWKWVRQVLHLPMPKVTQNGLYDIQYLRRYHISPANSLHDTMLLHHSMQPELPKSLGFLGSVYTNFPSWKNMRPKGDTFTTNKKDE